MTRLVVGWRRNRKAAAAGSGGSAQAWQRSRCEHLSQLGWVIKAHHKRRYLLGRDLREAGVLRPDTPILAPDGSVRKLAAARQLAQEVVVDIRLPTHSCSRVEGTGQRLD